MAWEGAKSLYFKLLHEQVGNEGTDGGAHGSTMYLFITLTLEKEVCVFKAEHQKGDYVLDGHAGPLM